MSGNDNEIDLRWIDKQIASYRRVLPRYRRMAKVLHDLLKKSTKKHAPFAIVQTRSKEIASFAEKIIRKRYKHKNPIKQFTDLCGARVITYTPDEVKNVSEFVKEHFVVDWDNSVDVSQRLKPTEFGYRSIHYIVQFKPGMFSNKDTDTKIPEIVFPDKTSKGHPMKAEIQIRTILEHAWADFAHDRSYKSAFTIPKRWQRELAGTAAMLEEVGQEFSRIQDGLQKYASAYGAYMSKEQIQNKIKELEIVLIYDKDNLELAHRVGKLYMTLGEWQKAIDVFSKYADFDYQPILRDLGVSLCKQHNNPKSRNYMKGQRQLERACRIDEKDVDALASQAGTWKKIDNEKARDLYRKAFEIDPSDPYPLSNYLDYEIMFSRNISLVSCMGPVISSAIKRCRNRADVGVNLPWSFYSMGKFYLLLGKDYESFAAYAKAVQVSSDDWMVDTSLRSLENLSIVKDKLPGYEWMRRLLIVGKAVIAGNKVKEAEEKVKEAKRKVQDIKKVKKAKEKTIEEAEEKVKKAKSEARKRAKKAKAAKVEVKELALAKYKDSDSVIIVVGGCDPKLEQEIQEYRELIFGAFKDFSGKVISGGTKQGISGLVGEIGERYSDIYTIRYLPEHIPYDATKDRRYSETHIIEEEGFSPLEPLQNWIDLIASGLDPSDVKIFGINGGTIAGVEYRIALALGATVVVVEESGREAAKLLLDNNWGTSERVVRLPADPMTARALVGPGSPKLSLNVRDIVAKEIHEEFRLTKQDNIRRGDPSMTDWNDLREDFKESNRQQADHIPMKLDAIGCEIRRAGKGKIKLETFNDDEIEKMAEMEHARWNAERLANGWTWGPKKDTDKKISPYLVAWSDLSEDVKDWDRETVRKIPHFLAKIELEVRRKPKKASRK